MKSLLGVTHLTAKRYSLHKRKLSDLYKSMFKRLEILTLSSEYIFSLMNFTVNNQEHFQTNSTIHGVNTRNKNQPYRPTTNLSCFRKSAYYAGIKILHFLVYTSLSEFCDCLCVTNPPPTNTVLCDLSCNFTFT
jgi:hypothetical protein